MFHVKNKPLGLEEEDRVDLEFATQGDCQNVAVYHELPSGQIHKISGIGQRFGDMIVQHEEAGGDDRIGVSFSRRSLYRYDENTKMLLYIPPECTLTCTLARRNLHWTGRLPSKILKKRLRTTLFNDLADLKQYTKSTKKDRLGFAWRRKDFQNKILS